MTICKDYVKFQVKEKEKDWSTLDFLMAYHRLFCGKPFENANAHRLTFNNYVTLHRVTNTKAILRFKSRIVPGSG